MQPLLAVMLLVLAPREPAPESRVPYYPPLLRADLAVDSQEAITTSLDKLRNELSEVVPTYRAFWEVKKGSQLPLEAGFEDHLSLTACQIRELNDQVELLIEAARDRNMLPSQESLVAFLDEVGGRESSQSLAVVIWALLEHPEGKSRLFDLLERPDSGPYLIARSILVTAMRFTTEERKRIGSLASPYLAGGENEAGFSSAIHRVHWLKHVEKESARIERLEERVDFLAGFAIGLCNQYGEQASFESMIQSPCATWAALELRRLAKLDTATDEALRSHVLEEKYRSGDFDMYPSHSPAAALRNHRACLQSLVRSEDLRRLARN